MTRAIMLAAACVLALGVGVAVGALAFPRTTTDTVAETAPSCSG